MDLASDSNDNVNSTINRWIPPAQRDLCVDRFRIDFGTVTAAFIEYLNLRKWMRINLKGRRLTIIISRIIL